MPDLSNAELTQMGEDILRATYIQSTTDRTFQLGIIEESSERIIHLARAIQSISVSYSMDLCPQVTVQLFDVNMEMLRNNYFSIGRPFVYKTASRAELSPRNIGTTGPSGAVADIQGNNLAESGLGYISLLYELASISVGPGQGSSPSITLELRSRPVMQMKRDRKPGSIKGASHVFVQQAALAYDLGFYTEKTSKDKSINKGDSESRSDSLWDVLSSLAGEAKFSLFESEGMLFFASMRHLFGQWGPETLRGFVMDEKTGAFLMREMNSWFVRWPYIGNYSGEVDTVVIGDVQQESKFARVLVPMQCPTFRRSDADIYQVEGSISLDRHSAMVLRPGMTIYVAGVPTFEDFYIITQVSFDHMSTTPVQVSFRKPEREDKYITDIEVGFIGSGRGTNLWS